MPANFFFSVEYSFFVSYATENRASEVSKGQLLQGVVKFVDRNRKEVHLSSDAGLISKSVVCLLLPRNGNIDCILLLIIVIFLVYW